MCGIIGYIGSKRALPVLLDGLKRLEYRGYDSAGVAVLHDNTLQVRRVKGKIRELEESLKASPLEGRCGLGHTRWATHGRPSEENAHPHRDCSGTLVVVHNGIIENYLPLKEKLIAEGHAFQTETDTEVIAHLVEKYFDGSLESAVRRALQDLEGAYAVAVISAREPDKIVVAKTGPPAVVGLGDGEFFISSDINPILSHTPRVVFM
jgi:glucosamine--fructose-6-phosphate aminotransferase (isomerizing)